MGIYLFKRFEESKQLFQEVLIILTRIYFPESLIRDSFCLFILKLLRKALQHFTRNRIGPKIMYVYLRDICIYLKNGGKFFSLNQFRKAIPEDAWYINLMILTATQLGREDIQKLQMPWWFTLDYKNLLDCPLRNIFLK